MVNSENQIDIVTQPNSDGSLNYFVYKYKNNTAKIGLGYTPQGVLNKILIPTWINLSQVDICRLILQLYIERINAINLINQINNIGNIANIGSIPSFINSPNIFKNDSFQSTNLNFWLITGGNPILDSTMVYINYPTLKLAGAGNAISQNLPPYSTTNLALTFLAYASANTPSNLTVTYNYTDGTGTSDGFNILAGSWAQYFASSINNAKRIASINFGASAADTIWLTQIMAVTS